MATSGVAEDWKRHLHCLSPSVRRPSCRSFIGQLLFAAAARAVVVLETVAVVAFLAGHARAEK